MSGIRWSSLIPKKMKNSNAGELCNSFDKDGDSKISGNELSDALPKAVKIFVGSKKINNLVSLFDKDNDNKMSKEEIDAYLSENYGISYEKASKMSAGELVDYIQDTEDAKKKNKKK